jgi:Ca-activated chloride channel family protein
MKMHLQTALLAAASAIVITACANNSAPRDEVTSVDGPGKVVTTEAKKEKDVDGIVVTGNSRVAQEANRADQQQYANAPPPPPAPLMAAPKMAGGALGRAMPSTTAQAYPQPRPGDIDREKYENVKLNPVKLTSEEPVSTFSIDVDTASYANVRRFLNQGVLPPKDAVRIEELVNYFDYDYALPKSKDVPFSTDVQIVPSPWGKGRELMRIGVQGYDIDRKERPPINLTLLVDVSGSMQDENKLPLVKKALKLLINEMDEKDHVSIAVYAGNAGAVLEPTSGADKQKIMAALDKLEAGGSTAGGEGLRLAYNLAKQNYDKNSVNRVMLMTDGDFNVGINDPERLKDFVERERESGVYLSVIGFGQDNYNDALMQKLAQNGNGVAAYIDTLNEARKLFNDDLGGSMFSIANDVKIQVEFNPAKVAEYRLIGYETRLLNKEDFNNDKVDAGEIGAGTSVTAIYELTPVGSTARLIDPSRYAPKVEQAAATTANEFAFLKMRWKQPGSSTSKLIDRPITAKDEVADISQASESMRFATAVAAYGQLLRGDPYLDKGFGWDQVIDLAGKAKGQDPFGYRSEFIQLTRLAKTAASQAALKQPSTGGQ